MRSTVSAIALAAVLGMSNVAGAQTGAPAPQKPAAEAPAVKPTPKPVEGQIMMQSDNTVLTTVLTGASVYGPDGASIGSINDVIVKTDGTIDGVVIGVGGFLGIGERNVAVQWSKIQLQPETATKVRIVLNATKDDLKNAEAFKTKADQEIARQVQQQRNAPAPMPGGQTNKTN